MISPVETVSATRNRQGSTNGSLMKTLRRTRNGRAADSYKSADCTQHAMPERSITGGGEEERYTRQSGAGSAWWGPGERPLPRLERLGSAIPSGKATGRERSPYSIAPVGSSVALSQPWFSTSLLRVVSTT